ncbi:MAG: type IV pilus assembly protein PilM [Halanaerobiaceae bacterium]
MLFRQHFTVIDIGTDSIKAAKFVQKRKGLFLDGLVHKRLTIDSIKDGRIVDEAVVANRLDDVLKELGSRNDRIITTVPNNNLVIRNMELPDMEEEQLAEAIKWESEDYLPFSVESAVEDYRILSREDNKVQILLVASKKDIVDNILGVFERIGVTPSAINIQPMALLSLVTYQSQQENIDTVAVVDIGTAGTRVVIGDDENIYLSRTIDIGGGEFTKVIMDEHKMSYIEAEELKKSQGIQEEENENNFDFAISQIATAGMGENQYLISLANNMAEQIGRSLDYYSMKYKQKVENVYITGGGSKLKRLKEIIENKTDRNLQIINPFDGIEQNNGMSLKPEEFSIAIGLGVSEVLADEG